MVSSYPPNFWTFDILAFRNLPVLVNSAKYDLIADQLGDTLIGHLPRWFLQDLHIMLTTEHQIKLWLPTWSAIRQFAPSLIDFYRLQLPNALVPMETSRARRPLQGVTDWTLSLSICIFQTHFTHQTATSTYDYFKNIKRPNKTWVTSYEAP